VYNTIYHRLLIFFGVAGMFMSCYKKSSPTPDFFLGGDLSYVNEVEDCGGVFKEKGQKVEPYKFFADKGSNIVRIRLWHTPDFGNYSNLKDVIRSAQRAKNNNQYFLLDLHYSDSWADPQKQLMPRAWTKIKNLEILGDSVYTYTYSVLSALYLEHLTPEMVQVGNEINIEVMQHPDSTSEGPINWKRNAFLLNKGIAAVRDFNSKNNTKIESMLHVAQPENAGWWFDAAHKNQIGDYQWIGLSYYPKWSKYNMDQLNATIKDLKLKYGKRVMIVETGYPYTSKNFDGANNVLDSGASLDKYPVSPEGQLSYMLDLKNTCKNAGCEGIIYWEPAWISTSCRTKWGQGSHWENATFFDAANGNEALPVFKFFQNQF